MTEAEIKAGLLTLEPTHPFYVALMAVLESDITDEMDGATQRDITDGARHFNAGRLAHAREIPAMIEGIVREAMTEREKAIAAKERKEK